MRAMRTERLAVWLVGLLVALVAITASANPLLDDAQRWERALPGIELLDPAPQAPPGLSYEDATGASVQLSASRGRLRLLNLWATWCAPCREEMPSLDRLAGELGGPEFEVLPIASGPNAMDDLRRFYEMTDLQALPILRSPDSQIAATLGAVALPSTFLIGPQGRVLARLTGDAQWDAPAIVDLIRGQWPVKTSAWSSSITLGEIP